MRYGLLLVFALPIAACGGSTDNEPLIAGTVTGNFDTTNFTVKNGVLGKTEHGTNVIALSSDSFGCSTINSPEPPEGNYAAVALPSLDVGIHSSLLVQVFDNHGDLNGVGSNHGTVEIVTLTDTSLVGSIAYSDTISGKSYGISGDFEVTHCP